MAAAPVGPGAAFFEVLDRHRASLVAALRRGGPEASAQGTRLASSAQVLASIENIMQDIITSLARNEAPAFTIDNRSSWENIKFEDSVGLQMVAHCTTRKIKSNSLKSVKKFALILKILSMIYKLVQSNTYATKRDIYYTDSQLFGTQTVVDDIINDISCMLRVPRRSLHILSTSKGLIAGNLRYIEEDGTKVHCPCGTTAVAVPSNIQGIRNLITDAKFLLIVEKDATFQRLLDDDFCNKMSPCIMVTGKGVPDLNTRLLVKKLWDSFHIPVFTLVDADPHGIEIMCIYKYGSRMEIMAESKMKAEIQALTSLSSDYLSRVYLPNKLKFGGWI
ncbi:meiotic recombination protein SPO11 isoform X5 [Ictidomys tridecemlineatus]|uniref:meiotic recombination protein SPO11 isoform X5 n=1 Tax=Ictidomys tridecemlineatus TaxID=43179 RepID=UPI001A9F85C3|nr:meiotic recombination protein SPO11 isoform X5 [Ictidomys tridecemlineatus]